MLLPGPEAQQLAFYIGWLLHKTKGGLVAGALFVLPGFLAILGRSYVYVLLGEVPLVEGLFFGLKAAVLAVVLQAVVRVGSRALKNNVMRGFAALARSEEHTSELQSLMRISYAVFCLKNKNKTIIETTDIKIIPYIEHPVQLSTIHV